MLCIFDLINGLTNSIIRLHNKRLQTLWGPLQWWHVWTELANNTATLVYCSYLIHQTSRYTFTLLCSTQGVFDVIVDLAY